MTCSTTDAIDTLKKNLKVLAESLKKISTKNKINTLKYNESINEFNKILDGLQRSLQVYTVPISLDTLIIKVRDITQLIDKKIYILGKFISAVITMAVCGIVILFQS